MPVSLLIALFLAFGTDAFLGSSPVDRDVVVRRMVEASGSVVLVGLVALAFSIAVLIRIRHRGRVTLGARRVHAVGSQLVGALTLAGYAWVILGLGWVDVVRDGLELRNSILVDELLILLPYVLAQVVGWWGLYPAEMALRPPSMADRPPIGAARHLILRARQTLGMVLPATLVFSLAQDLARWLWPARVEEPGFQMGMMATMGALVLFLAPAFVRLSWPTRPLPPGPLRDERQVVGVARAREPGDLLVGKARVGAEVTAHDRLLREAPVELDDGRSVLRPDRADPGRAPVREQDVDALGVERPGIRLGPPAGRSAGASWRSLGRTARLVGHGASSVFSPAQERDGRE